jgi:maltooligosyltrehalose trehalohydrolase
MLFMGEEWAASTPWQFFTDHTDPELAEAVRRGRRREFAEHGWAEEDVPDPQDPATRDRSCLDWSELEREPHARVLDWYRRLLALRHEQPDLTDPDLADTKVAYDADQRWLAFRRGDVRVAVNLAKSPAVIPLGPREARVLAAWEPVDAPGADGVLHVPGESCVVLLQA